MLMSLCDFVSEAAVFAALFPLKPCVTRLVPEFQATATYALKTNASRCS